MESTCKYIPCYFNWFQRIEEREEEDKWSLQEANALQEWKNNEINYGIYILAKYSTKYVNMLSILEISDYSNKEIFKIYLEKYLFPLSEL